jgi:exopolysaccharide biosynthesis polyprenyl glycosylphosphotransferase
MKVTILKKRILLIDIILFSILWIFPLLIIEKDHFSKVTLYQITINVFFQLFLNVVLGHYDDHISVRLISRRRLFINAMISFLITFFIFKFFSLYFFQTFFIRIRYYFIFIFPFQVFLYWFFSIFNLKRSSDPQAQKICVLGDSEDVNRLQKWLKENGIFESEYKIDSIIDINNSKWINLHGIQNESFHKKSNLFEILKEHDLVIYFPSQTLDTRETRHLLRFGTESGSFFDFGTFCGLMREMYPIDDIDTDWYVRQSTNLWLKISLYLRFRRYFDFILSLFLFILSFPLWILAAIGIFISSKGPIFYTQERIGQFGKKFHIIKFRTMTLDAERSGPQMASSQDKRVTLFGKFLRRSRIDELPQVINVLKGEMSFIGPRPEREHFELILNKDLPLLQLRNFIAPGITGLAQVNGDYANDLNSYRKKLGYDLFYILNLSPFLDLSILLRTVRTVLFKKGS